VSAHVKAYDLVEACKGLGLGGGEEADAWQSKAKYVKSRLSGLNRDELIQLARNVLGRWDSFSLREDLRRFLCDNQPQLSLVTRQRLYDELIQLPNLPGRLDLATFLGELMPVDSLPSLELRFETFMEEIFQHTERNDDWDSSEILARINFMGSSDEFIYEFLGLLVHPTVREGTEQSDLVDALNRSLRVDGATLEEVDEISGVPVYGIVRPGVGVRGRPKNLIFASRGPKPEIVLADAMNNDVQIVRNAEYVLVYDRLMASSGLTWGDLIDWWTTQPDVTTENPDRALFLRLRESLMSQPEKWFFAAYYRLFKDRLPDWPALIPQVYLHFDPKTIRELAGRRRFVTQRMDFLLLLRNRRRVVIEIDGVQHYAEENGTASPARYAEMVRGDRLLRLRGYEVYRFGGKELTSPAATRDIVREFTDALMEGEAALTGE